jgi:hypothetical protein
VRTVSGELFGNTFVHMAGRSELLEISVNGDRVAVIEVDKGMSDAGEKGLTLETPPIAIKAGPQRIAAAFVPRSVGPVDDLLVPIEQTLIDTRIGTGYGVTMAPHLQELSIAGPMNVTGVSDTPSRRKIFTCQPSSASQERACATDILRRLATQAYRGPVRDDLNDLLSFYTQARADGGDFEEGIRFGVQGILANPRFMFRMEQTPPAGNDVYRVTDVDLASRLSFFLWGTLPDQELLNLASKNQLSAPAVLEKQTRRMLADPRAEAVGVRFAAQWLRLQDIDKVHPDPNNYPNFDDNLANDMRRETEMFFNSLVREDRSMLDLFRADYTFVNERLARHYGFPGIAGEQFRKVQYPDDTRRGLLGQGSVLVQTSLANRTSPVLRGKWVMEVLMGTPPPPPPPDVPGFDETASAKNGRMLTTRERMEIHRANPTCNSCHRFMDPIGLALDNFDVTGTWRERENGAPLDTTGEYYDGTPITKPSELLAVLMKRPAPLVRTFTENLMAYALGRRVEYFDQPTVRAIAKAAEASEYKMSSFILGVVKSDAFQMKRAEPITTDVAVR